MGEEGVPSSKMVGSEKKMFECFIRTTTANACWGRSTLAPCGSNILVASMIGAVMCRIHEKMSKIYSTMYEFLAELYASGSLTLGASIFLGPMVVCQCHLADMEPGLNFDL